MIIVREINGDSFEFELTEQEIIAAHLERQTVLDRYLFEGVLACMDDDEISDCYGVSKDEFAALIPQMIEMWKNRREMYDYYREEAEDDAIEQIICDCIEVNVNN